MSRNGITIGKFMPLHKGHEYMIRFGSSMMDTLTVLVSGPETDETLMDRFFEVQNFVREENLHNVLVIMHTDQAPTPVNIDENGTVLDEEFQEYWVKEFAYYGSKVTHIVTSDLYGKVIAERMGLEWLPVDPKREIVPISATKIRKFPYDNFHYISKYAKSFLKKTRKKIAIVGPESSGKTTMAKHLAFYFNGAYSPEYGRTISEAHGLDLTEEYFMDIFNGQLAQDKIVAESSDTPVLFIDTEAYTTFLFGQLYLDKDLTEVSRYAVDKSDIDLYILLSPTVAFVQDGGRILEDQKKREKFFDDMLQFLKENNKNFVVIEDEDFTRRNIEAKFAVVSNFFNPKE